MAFKSSAKETGTVKKTFTFEVPNFMPEAELLLIPGFGRRVCSEQYKYEGYGDSFTGNIIIQGKDGKLEFASEIQPGYHFNPIFKWDVYGIYDVECTIDAVLHCEGFQYECGERYRSSGSIKKGKPHRFSKLVPFHELEAAVQNVLEKQVCLTITSTVTLFKDPSSSRWIEPAKGTTGTKSPSFASPFLQRVLHRKFSDLVIESDGKEFPVHSLVLKCTSPVFAAMLETDMKEAASDRIKVDDVGPAAVEQLLAFNYNGKFTANDGSNTEISDDLITELLHCAYKYEIPEMKQDLFVQMLSKGSAENAVKFFNAAELYGAEESLLRELLDFCKKNLMELPKGRALQEFVRKYLKDLF